MIFERYYDRLQLEHFALYHHFFASDADYTKLTEMEWVGLKRRVTMGRFLQYGWHCEMSKSWRAQLSHVEREILANWDWEFAYEHEEAASDKWRQFFTPEELAYIDGQTDELCPAQAVEGVGGGPHEE